MPDFFDIIDGFELALANIAVLYAVVAACRIAAQWL